MLAGAGAVTIGPVVSAWDLRDWGCLGRTMLEPSAEAVGFLAIAMWSQDWSMQTRDIGLSINLVQDTKKTSGFPTGIAFFFDFWEYIHGS